MTTPGPDRRPLTPAMVAERWRCSERHVRNELERGRLRYFKLGQKLIRIPWDAVEEYEGRPMSEWK